MNVRLNTLLSAGVAVVYCAQATWYIATLSPEVGKVPEMFGRGADSPRTIVIRSDFSSFYYATKAAAAGRNMYDAYLLDSLAAADSVTNHVLPYLYPPFFAIVAQPLGTLSPETAGHVWDIGQILLLGIASVILLRSILRDGDSQKRKIVTAAGICLGAVVLPLGENLFVGQINTLVLFFITLSLFFYTRREHDWLAGALLATACLLKITPALLLLYFIVERNARVVAGFLLTMLLGIIVTILLTSLTPWEQFARFFVTIGYTGSAPGGFHPRAAGNLSLTGFLYRLLGIGALPRIFSMSGAIILLAIPAYRQLLVGDPHRTLAPLLPYTIVMLIASPVTWLHHLIYLLPPAAFWFRSVASRPHTMVERRHVRLIVTAAAAALIFSLLNYYFLLGLVHADWKPNATAGNLAFLLMLFAISLFRVRSNEISGTPG